MTWFSKLQPANVDSSAVRAVKLRVRLWLLLNVAVVSIPLSFRLLIKLFAPAGLNVTVFAIEEVFFFSLFAVASALVDLWEHTKAHGAALEASLDAYFWSLLLTSFLMALVYGLAFSGLVSNLAARHYAVMTGLIVAGIVFAMRAQLLIVRETIVRTMEQGI